MFIRLDVDPHAKARARMARDGTCFTPLKTKSNENHLKYELRAKSKRLLWDEPIGVEVDFYIEKPKRMPKGRIFPSVRPDLDNYVKQILDAGNKYLWRDDSCICTITARKFYSDAKGYIKISVFKLNE